VAHVQQLNELVVLIAELIQHFDRLIIVVDVILVYLERGDLCACAVSESGDRENKGRAEGESKSMVTITYQLFHDVPDAVLLAR